MGSDREMDPALEEDAAPSEDMELDGRVVKATISRSGVIRWTSSSRSDSLDVQSDLLGFSRDHSSLTLFTFKCAEVGCCGSRRKARVRKDVVLKFRNPEVLESWCQSIQACFERAGRPKRLIVFLNPFGGKKLAKKCFQQQVEPLLRAAGVACSLQVTRHQNHAKELARSMDISQYDGVVCVSGDGVLVEVLNGILEREDWEAAIKLPLGVIPAGTGNGMAKSVLDYGHEICNVENATFAIIKGGKQHLDVATVVQGQVCFHSVLLLTWGIVADVDFESEKLRSLGYLRTDIYSLIRLVRLRKYQGSLAYIPAPGYEGLGNPVHADSELFPSDTAERNAAHDKIWQEKNQYRGPTVVPARSEWQIARGKFILVWLQNVPWASETVLAAPNAELADGFLDLIIIKDCPWWKLFGLFLKLSDGTYVKSKHVEYLKVKAFRLAPGGRVGSNVEGGYIDLDGEVLARGRGAYGDGSKDPMLYGPMLEMKVQKGLATVYCAS